MPAWLPYLPGRKVYPALSAMQREQLSLVGPCPADEPSCFPCAVVLTDGSSHERVYIQDAQSYVASWGVWPEDDQGKRAIDITHVVLIRESRDRLPQRFARVLYYAGESGMGYSVFTLRFKDGTSQAYIGGNAVDFVEYPPGKSTADIASIVPHEGRDQNPRQLPAYVWCLHGSGESKLMARHWTT